MISILFLAMSVANQGLTTVCDCNESPPDPAPEYVLHKIVMSFVIIRFYRKINKERFQGESRANHLMIWLV
jgi:hypothetical protein